MIDIGLALFIVGCGVACFVSGFLWHKLLCNRVEKVEPCETIDDVMRREG